MSWDDDPAVVLSAGPVRVVTDEPDPDYQAPPLLGFRSLVDQQLVREVARLRAEHGPLGLDLPESGDPPAPLLWDGDQA